MRGAGFAKPRIAVCALNPHGGENGLFGREEIEVIAPAVARAAARGIGCKGPFPSDTVFLKAFGGDFDGVLSMYHDQGQIATKLKGFNRGVTVTAGLKTVFTTPAHGTAFDIVAGVATTGALERRCGSPRLAATRTNLKTHGKQKPFRRRPARNILDYVAVSSSAPGQDFPPMSRLGKRSVIEQRARARRGASRTGEIGATSA